MSTHLAAPTLSDAQRSSKILLSQHRLYATRSRCTGSLPSTQLRYASHIRRAGHPQPEICSMNGPRTSTGVDALSPPAPLHRIHRPTSTLYLQQRHFFPPSSPSPLKPRPNILPLDTPARSDTGAGRWVATAWVVGGAQGGTVEKILYGCRHRW